MDRLRLWETHKLYIGVYMCPRSTQQRQRRNWEKYIMKGAQSQLQASESEIEATAFK